MLAQAPKPSFLSRHAGVLYRAFKYTVYCLLLANVFLFAHEDYLASREMFGKSLSWANLFEAFSATIDTAAWVTLLLMFELETAVIDDEKLRGPLKWVLLALRILAYSFIVSAFYGYCVKYNLVSQFAVAPIQDACSLVGTPYTYVHLLDEYFPITQEVCAAMQGVELQQIAGTQIVATPEALTGAIRLAQVDIINAGDWLVIVALLEIEVYLQLHNRLSDRLLFGLKWVKGGLYAILFACAVYWGFEGDFLDFWDAFLWLVAFVFIEMNIFNWHAETMPDSALESATTV